MLAGYFTFNQIFCPIKYSFESEVQIEVNKIIIILLVIMSVFFLFINFSC